MDWRQLAHSVWQLHDSCDVYAISAPAGWLVINAGTGKAASAIEQLPAIENGTVHLLLTHHFRDHTGGAGEFTAIGATIWGPYWEQDYFVDAEQQFRQRQTWNSYDNRWDRFGPVHSLAVDHWLMDYATHTIAGLDVTVLPTPGVTTGAISLIMTVDDKRICFSGELIHSPGKLARVAPLQYDYNDFLGCQNVWYSCERLLDEGLDVLYPSVGVPMNQPSTALSGLRDNLQQLNRIHPGLAAQLQAPQTDDLKEFIPGRLYLSANSVCSTHFLISNRGRVLAIDYGYNTRDYTRPLVHHLSNRRPMLHGMKGLERRFGKASIDTVLVSHFHDDHVNGIPMLQRLFGTEVMAAALFSDLLEHPMRYDRPCLWHEPIPVDRKLPCGEPIIWDDMTITLYPMSGHTRFSTLICIEFDDVRAVHTGDQIFFQGTNDYSYEPAAPMFTNHVYKNGLEIGCYRQSYEHLKRFQPNWVMTGHTEPYPVIDGWLAEIEKGAIAFDEVHQALMPLSDDDVHFGAESQAAKLTPYRVVHADSQPINFDGWVINPFAIAAEAEIRIIAPDGWESDSMHLALLPRGQHSFSITVRPPANCKCRRQPIALDLIVGGHAFGQVAEALVTLGSSQF